MRAVNAFNRVLVLLIALIAISALEVLARRFAAFRSAHVPGDAIASHRCAVSNSRRLLLHMCKFHQPVLAIGGFIHTVHVTTIER
ncbi:hypothetical protein [Paraburkholderia sp. 2C]|jgi:hypothetical protein